MQKLDLKSFDAVAFDFEGTLADTLPTHHTSRLAAFKQHGYGHITREEHELGPTYGSSNSDIFGGILRAAGEIDETIPFTENLHIQRVIKTKAALFAVIAAKGFEAMPGAIEFVRAIAPLYLDRLALVTSSKERFVLSFVKRYSLDEYFPRAHIIGDDTIVAEGLDSKPSADPYLLAIKLLKATNLLVFEDTVPGVAAAKKAGATVIALGFDAPNTKLFTENNLDYPPDIFFRDYNEAKEALGIS